MDAIVSVDAIDTIVSIDAIVSFVAVDAKEAIVSRSEYPQYQLASRSEHQ